MYIFCRQCYCTIYRLRYNVNITLFALGNQKIRVTHFIIIFTLLWWSGTEPTASPRYPCIFELSVCFLYIVSCCSRVFIEFNLYYVFFKDCFKLQLNFKSHFERDA